MPSDSGLRKFLLRHGNVFDDRERRGSRGTVLAGTMILLKLLNAIQEFHGHGHYVTEDGPILWSWSLVCVRPLMISGQIKVFSTVKFCRSPKILLLSRSKT